MTVMYADELFIENAIIDYILLLATAKITGRFAFRWRILTASVLGGVYSVFSVLVAQDFLGSIFIKILMASLMVFIVYGYDKRFIRTCLVFMAVSAAFAGAVMAFSLLGGASANNAILGPVSFKVLVLSFAACYTIFSLVFSRLTKHRVEGGITSLRISVGKHTAEISALRDSGNVLTDPVTGEPVIICCLEVVSPLLDKRTVEILRIRDEDPASALRDIGNNQGIRFHLVPYNAVGVHAGLLAAFRPDCIEADGIKQKTGLIAIAPSGAFLGKGYSALIGIG